MEETTPDETCQLITALQQFMNAEGWNASIEENETDTGTQFTVMTSMLISEQKHRLFIEIEPPCHIFLFLYTAYFVPRSRLGVMSRIINRINTSLVFGRLAVNDGPDPRPVQFRTGLHLENSILTRSQVDAMVSLGVSTFRMYGEVLAATALSRRSLDDLWLEHLAYEEEHSEWAGVSVPRVLH